VPRVPCTCHIGSYTTRHSANYIVDKYLPNEVSMTYGTKFVDNHLSMDPNF